VRDYKASGRASPSRWVRVRVVFLAMVFWALLAGVLGRAIVLQVYERERLRELAHDQYVRQIEIPARRGDIFDRHGLALAQSVEVDSIWVDPSLLPSAPSNARALARALHLDPDELKARFARAKRFAWVKRQAKLEEVEAVQALALPGIGFTREPRRFYPHRQLAAQVIGIAGMDGSGLEGLEAAFEQELSGRNLQLLGLRDAKGRKLLTQGTLYPPNRQGASLTLTLDRQIQYFSEKALAKAVEEAKAISGMAVVLDPRTGEILSLANFPSFNPNTPYENPKELFRNRTALDVFEPGSTFKSFAIAAALDEEAIKSEDVFYCEEGAWDVGRHTIHDTHPHGWLSPAKILQVSSNIGAAKIAQVLGRERLVRYYERFGFGERAQLGLPGEARGSVPFPKADVSLATAAFGHGVSATAVQLAAAYGALANGGMLMRPWLVSKVTDPDGAVLLEKRPAEVRRAVSSKTAKQIVSMLEGVVEREGTAPRAKMVDYRVAGKTGTAQKVDPVAGGYSDKRIASFVGIVPAEDPRVVILVVIDEPKTDVYGGLIAAPAFKEIATAVMAYLGVPTSRPRALAAPALASNSAEREEAKVRPAASASDVTEQTDRGTVRVPDLQGSLGRDAVERLLTAALQPRLSGSGRVVSQTPSAGSIVEKGSRVNIELGLRQ
jgi:cell division protein FtsI (penicillin-binding protein 3)